MNTQQETWTVDRCAQEWGITPSTWRSYVATGHAPEPLPGYNGNRQRRWAAQTVRDYPRPGRGKRTDLAIRRGVATYDPATSTVTVITSDGETLTIGHDRLPANLEHTLAEHGWSTDCPEATTSYFTPVGDGRQRAAVISRPMPDGWEETLRSWVGQYGDLRVAVQGTRRSVRYLLIRPGDVLIGDAQVLELGDPNGMLRERAHRSINKAHTRAAVTGEPYRITFAELLNPDLIEVPECPHNRLDDP
ncbi:MAG: hypothetical protein JO100_09995 [Pseudonocardia sp.]|nr:hypothetical protein [Pseudonocardia sp.]